MVHSLLGRRIFDRRQAEEALSAVDTLAELDRESASHDQPDNLEDDDVQTPT